MPSRVAVTTASGPHEEYPLSTESGWGEFVLLSVLLMSSLETPPLRRSSRELLSKDQWASVAPSPPGSALVVPVVSVWRYKWLKLSAGSPATNATYLPFGDTRRGAP